MPLYHADHTFLGRKFKTGLYYGGEGVGAVATITPTLDRVEAHPMYVGEATTFDRISASVQAAGDANSVVRLGVWADDGHYYPGALVLDAGTISGVSGTVQEIVISLTLAAGIYWLGAVWQVGTVGSGRMNGQTVFNSSFVGRTSGANTSRISYVHDGVTGAFGTPFTTTPVPSSQHPVMWLRAV